MLNVSNGDICGTRPLIKPFRFNETKGTYDAFTLIVFRLDNEVDLHGFNGKPSIAMLQELTIYLRSYGITHVNAIRHGKLKRYKLRY